jgi:hypothetical protein
MYEECTDAVIKCTKNTLSLAILLGRVWAGEAKESAMGREERAIHSTIKFASIVSLKTLMEDENCV